MSDKQDIKDEIIIEQLSDLLNQCLETESQEYSFKVRCIERQPIGRKLIVAFNIEMVDGKAMFAGY